MSAARKSSITGAWIALVAVTLGSVATAELVGHRVLAVATVMGIAAAKGAVILWRFMDLGGAPIGMRYYLGGWTIACAAMIAVLFAAGQ